MSLMIDWMLGVRKRMFGHEIGNPGGRSVLEVKSVCSVLDV